MNGPGYYTDYYTLLDAARFVVMRERAASPAGLTLEVTEDPTRLTTRLHVRQHEDWVLDMLVREKRFVIDDPRAIVRDFATSVADALFRRSDHPTAWEEV